MTALRDDAAYDDAESKEVRAWIQCPHCPHSRPKGFVADDLEAIYLHAYRYSSASWTFCADVTSKADATALYAIHPKHQKSVKNNILSGITLGCWLGLLWRRGGATKHVFRQLSGIWICCGFAHQQNIYPLHRCHRVGVLLATHLLPLIHVVCEQHR